jgi:hypothetical protein
MSKTDTSNDHRPLADSELDTVAGGAAAKDPPPPPPPPWSGWPIGW